MFAQAVERIDGLKVYSASRPKIKVIEDGETVSLGKGTRGTRICLTIGHVSMPIEVALVAGKVPPRLTVQFPPQYAGDEPRKYTYNFRIMSTAESSDKTKELLEVDEQGDSVRFLSLIHISEPTRPY